MNVALLYLRILKKFDPSHPEHKSYEESAVRFLKTYLRYIPEIPHRLVVVNCGDSRHDGMFDCVVTDYRTYSGGGYDCGTYQEIGSKLDSDLVVGLNTHTHFWKHGWLERIVEAVEKHGPGVYGATASYELHPHLRTPCIVFSPQVMAKYPYKVTSREQASWFEAGPNNFSLWALKNNYPSLLVTADGVMEMKDWRKPDNIFRRGDQSNCLVRDRHTDIFDAETPQEREILAARADTWIRK